MTKRQGAIVVGQLWFIAAILWSFYMKDNPPDTYRSFVLLFLGLSAGWSFGDALWKLKGQ